MKNLYYILGLLIVPINAMLLNVRVIDSDAGDEPAILNIIRDNRETLIRRPAFDEVAMITKKTLSPENDLKNGSLIFRVIKGKVEDNDAVLGFIACDRSVANKAQIALVAIDQKYRGNRYAQRLLASTVTAIRAESNEPIDIWAYVCRDNAAARRVWEKVAGNIPDAILHWEEGTGNASDSLIAHLK